MLQGSISCSLVNADTCTCRPMKTTMHAAGLHLVQPDQCRRLHMQIKPDRCACTPLLRGVHLLQPDPALPGSNVAAPQIICQRHPAVCPFLPFTLLPYHMLLSPLRFEHYHVGDARLCCKHYPNSCSNMFGTQAHAAIDIVQHHVRHARLCM